MASDAITKSKNSIDENQNGLQMALVKAETNQMSYDDDDIESDTSPRKDKMQILHFTIENNQNKTTKPSRNYRLKLPNEGNELQLEEVDPDEISTVQCPVCGLNILSVMLETHKSSCLGVSDVNDMDSEPDDDESDPNAICVCCDKPKNEAHLYGMYKCNECPGRFTRNTDLKRHEALIHQAIKANAWRFSCESCKLLLSSRSALLNHLRESQMCLQATDITIHPCDVCSKAFTNVGSLKAHLLRHVNPPVKQSKDKPSKPQHCCSYCGKYCPSAAARKLHERSHTGEKPFQCDFCEKAFPSKMAQQKHNRVHTGERPFSCAQCKRKFAAKETLNRHMRTHTGDCPFECTYCGKRFIQKTQLNAHLFYHTGENAFNCPHCEQVFNRRGRLTTHIKFTHENAEQMKCPDCEKTFKRKEDLARHLMTHSNVKPFNCATCAKKFATKAALNVHELTHRREQPTTCYDCGRAFIRYDCLMRHMRAKHRDLLKEVMAKKEKELLHSCLLKTLNIPDTETKIMPDNPTSSKDVFKTEMKLSQAIQKLLIILVEESVLKQIGWPSVTTESMLEELIARCNHIPDRDPNVSYLDRLRNNTKMLFTFIIDDPGIKAMLDTKQVDDVIYHVLELAEQD